MVHIEGQTLRSVLGEPVESSSDVFSMGLMFYELTTGTHPFQWGKGHGYFRAILPESSKLCGMVPITCIM